MLEIVLKVFLVLSSICSHSLQGVFTMLSKQNKEEYGFSVFMSSLLTESGKLLVSFIALQWQLAHGKAIRYNYSVREIFLWIIPSCLYVIANNLFFVVISISDSPITQQVFGSLEIVVVGLANVFVLKKQLSGVQWAALLLLTSSVASIQIAKSGTQQLIIPVLPAVLTICSSSLAGLAGVVIEKMMKGKKRISIFQQNMWLNFWGAILNFLCLVVENGRSFPQRMSLIHFNVYALLTVANTIVMGLVTVGILKVLSSVVKSFTSSASLVLTSILSSILFDVELNTVFYLAVFNLSIAVYLYKSFPVIQSTSSIQFTPISDLSVTPDAIEISDNEVEIVTKKASNK